MGLPLSDARLESWLKFISAIVCTSIIAWAGQGINNKIQQQKLELQKMAEFGQYVDYALNSNIGTRLSLAEYFVAVTEDKELKKRWENFFQVVNEEYGEIQAEKEQKKEELKKSELKEDEREKLELRMRELEQELKIVPSASVPTCAPGIQYCTKKPDCARAGFSWYKNSCHVESEPTCASDVQYCTKRSDCTNQGYYWYNNTCNAQPKQ